MPVRETSKGKTKCSTLCAYSDSRGRINQKRRGRLAHWVGHFVSMVTSSWVQWAWIVKQCNVVLWLTLVSQTKVGLVCETRLTPTPSTEALVVYCAVLSTVSCTLAELGLHVKLRVLMTIRRWLYIHAQEKGSAKRDVCLDCLFHFRTLGSCLLHCS